MKATDLKIGNVYYYGRLCSLGAICKISIISISESYHSFRHECQGRNVKYQNITTGFISNMFVPNDVSDFDAHAKDWYANDGNILQKSSYEFIAVDKPSLAKAIRRYCYSNEALFGKRVFSNMMNDLKKL